MRRPFLPSPNRVAAILMTVLISAAAQAANDSWSVRFASDVLQLGEGDRQDSGRTDVDVWSVLIGADHQAGSDLPFGSLDDLDVPRDAVHGEHALAAVSPWSRGPDARLSAGAAWKADDRWNLFAVPSVEWFEDTSFRSDSGRFGDLTAAVAYQVNDRLSIGPGFGVRSGFGDGVDWIPMLALDWRLSDSLAVSSGRGFTVNRGPGLALDWTPSDRWAVSLGARYKRERYRLNDEGFALGGIGLETSVPVYLGATRRFGRHLSLSFVAGVEFAGELRLEDGDGRLIDESSYDSAPFGGATLDLRF